MNRRDFIRTIMAATGGLALAGCSRLMSGAGMAAKTAVPTSATPGMQLPRRALGKTGEKLSIVGLGGIVVMNAEPAAAAKVVADAVAAGVNYFDVAPTYGDAELKLGPALKPYRGKSFLACKTTRRDRGGAWEELHNSLERLQTDHINLYQLHALIDVEKDVHVALGKDGAIEALLKAKKEGLIRHIGFSAHSPQAALSALREFDFDSMMYPINFACHFQSGFDEEPLAEARKRGVGIIALKAMARQAWPKDADRRDFPKCWYQPLSDPEEIRTALSWSLAQGIAAALPPGDERLFRLALAAAPKCAPPTKEELAKLAGLARTLQPFFK